MAICLPQENIEKFKKALKNKYIKMEDLLNLGTQELTELLAPYAGENVTDIVKLFESKRILKNKVLGLKNAVSKIGEIGRYAPDKAAEVQKAKEEFKAMQTERILNPKEEEVFYNTLADKIMGTHISREEAKLFFDLSSKTSELKEKSYDSKMNDGKGGWKSEADKIEYGNTQYASKILMSGLKGNSAPLKTILKGRFNEFKTMWKGNQLQEKR